MRKIALDLSILLRIFVEVVPKLPYEMLGTEILCELHNEAKLANSMISVSLTANLNFFSRKLLVLDPL